MTKTKTWQEAYSGTDTLKLTGERGDYWTKIAREDTVSFDFFKPILHDVLSKLEGTGQVHIPLKNTTYNQLSLKELVSKYGIAKRNVTSNEFSRNDENLHKGYFVRYQDLKQRKSVMTTKIADKLNKVNESFTVYMYDNGYMVEVGGRNEEDNWITSKIICSSLDEVIELVKEAAEMPRND
jgi:hypothetical protein